jgi:hypothetical protein
MAMDQKAARKRPLKNKPLLQHDLIARQSAVRWAQSKRPVHNISQQFALKKLLQTYKRILLTLLVIVIAGCILYLYSTFGHHRNTRLPMRHYVILYPNDGVRIKQSLQPYYYMTRYAVANKDNYEAAKRLRIMNQRKQVLGKRSYYNQHQYAHAWEQDDFTSQLTSDSIMDQVCGPGFSHVYSSQEHLRQDLVHWCMLASQMQDAFVAFDVEPLEPLTRGLTGIVAQYITADGTAKEQMYSYLVLVPVHARMGSAERNQAEYRPPQSSKVPANVLFWIINNGSKLSASEYREALEVYMYSAVQLEQENWVIWQIVCDRDLRMKWNKTMRITATSCAKAMKLSDPTCCSIYDPEMDPMVK